MISISWKFTKVFCGSVCDLSWRMFPVHLGIICVLLLFDGRPYKYQLSPSALMYHFKAPFFPLMIFYLDDLLTMQMGC